MSPHIQVSVLLSGFQGDLPSLVFDGLLVVALAAYLLGVLRLRSRGRRWPAGRTACYAAGLFALFVAIGSGLAAYDDVNPPAHVIQHWLLMMIGPPLLVLGRPLALLAQAASRPVQRRVIAIEHNRALSVVLGPIGWVAYVATMPAYFLTAWYPESVAHLALHLASHAWFLLVGLVYATELLNPEVRRRSLPAGRLLAVVAAMPIEAALGFALMLWPWPLVPGETAAATHSAGVTFFVTAMVGSGLMAAIVLGQWALADERRVRRLERRAEVAPTPILADLPPPPDDPALPPAPGLST